ncbi:MAG: tripartite tricarboxylate transporter substrate binding protein [Burkholderiales bacterium]|nr:tripartite tricarboxylate transporter substrate binding protein [Burkholderiales bacterium]MDP2399426.1 tripartite tricarboxylate transporter substrate binding protein [Burkholderiales bacterium]
MRLISVVVAGVLWALLPVSALAQTGAYPVRPLRFVLPFPAGGATDTIGRSIAQKLSESMGHNVLVDNRPGAGGNLGVELVAKSAADGYTLLLCSPTCAISPSLHSRLNYDPQRDLAPISLVATIPTLLVVNPAVPAKSLQELLALARARPGQLNYGSGGVGSSNHLAMELLKSLARIDIVHVAYKGTGQALNSLAAGEIQMVGISPPAVLPLLSAGKVRVLAVLREKRIPALPEVPTAAEAGLPGLIVNTWYGMLTRSGTPEPRIALLNTRVGVALKATDTRERLASVGVEAAGSTPLYFGDFMKSEIVRLGRIVREAGIRAE